MKFLDPLASNAANQRIEHGIEFSSSSRRGQAHGRRENVVRGLPIIDVIVGMHH